MPAIQHAHAVAYWQRHREWILPSVVRSSFQSREEKKGIGHVDPHPCKGLPRKMNVDYASAAVSTLTSLHYGEPGKMLMPHLSCRRLGLITVMMVNVDKFARENAFLFEYRDFDPQPCGQVLNCGCVGKQNQQVCGILHRCKSLRRPALPAQTLQSRQSRQNRAFAMPLFFTLTCQSASSC